MDGSPPTGVWFALRGRVDSSSYTCFEMLQYCHVCLYYCGAAMMRLVTISCRNLFKGARCRQPSDMATAVQAITGPVWHNRLSAACELAAAVYTDVLDELCARSCDRLSSVMVDLQPFLVMLVTVPCSGDYRARGRGAATSGRSIHSAPGYGCRNSILRRRSRVVITVRQPLLYYRIPIKAWQCGIVRKR